MPFSPINHTKLQKNVRERTQRTTNLRAWPLRLADRSTRSAELWRIRGRSWKMNVRTKTRYWSAHLVLLQGTAFFHSTDVFAMLYTNAHISRTGARGIIRLFNSASQSQYGVIPKGTWHSITGVPHNQEKKKDNGDKLGQRESERWAVRQLSVTNSRRPHC